jgi:hypothetical protein
MVAHRAPGQLGSLFLHSPRRSLCSACRLTPALSPIYYLCTLRPHKILVPRGGIAPSNETTPRPPEYRFRTLILADQDFQVETNNKF